MNSNWHKYFFLKQRADFVIPALFSVCLFELLTYKIISYSSGGICKTQVGYSQCTSTAVESCVICVILCADCKHCEFYTYPLNCNNYNKKNPFFIKKLIDIKLYFKVYNAHILFRAVL